MCTNFTSNETHILILSTFINENCLSWDFNSLQLKPPQNQNREHIWWNFSLNGHFYSAASANVHHHSWLILTMNPITNSIIRLDPNLVLMDSFGKPKTHSSRFQFRDSKFDFEYSIKDSDSLVRFANSKYNNLVIHDNNWNTHQRMVIQLNHNMFDQLRHGYG